MPLAATSILHFNQVCVKKGFFTTRYKLKRELNEMTGKKIIAIICSACLTFFMCIDSFAREPYFRQVDIFESGTEGYDNFRIPALVCNWYGMVFAFCEGRAENADNGDIDVLMRRSLDNGKTWGSIEVVWDNGPNTCGNPCPVYDRETSTIWP